MHLDNAPFDYTARDFSTLRADLRRRVQTEIPEWQDNDAAFESVILDMFAYVGDILNFYIDRQAAESFIQTATQRDSILALADMFGYIPSPQTASRGVVRFTRQSAVTGDIAIPAGTQVFSQTFGEEPIVFETEADYILDSGNTYEDLNVVEGSTVNMEPLGASTGIERQNYPLFRPNVIKDSVRVYTLDGPPDSNGAPTAVEWSFINRLIDASFYEQVFTLFTDDNGITHVRFGDGILGAIPTTGAPVVATYRHGFGARGNIGPGAVSSLVAGTELALKIASVSNAAAFTGGSDVESLESMRRNVPRSLRSLERAVTLEDYGSVAVQVPGVAKANANATIPTNVLIYVAPSGGGAPPAQLLTDVEDYLDDRKMVGTTVTAIAATYVPINVTVSLTVNSRYRRTVVADAVKEAITASLDFDIVEFQQTISKAGVFRSTLNIPGVEFFDITAHNRTGSGNIDTITLTQGEIPVPGTITVNATGGILPL
jgi:uncharacterized phage protein gp47/JayE